MYAGTRTHTALTVAAAVAATVALTGLSASAAPNAPHTRPISVTPEGKAGNGASGDIVISRDGRYAAFSSSATDLVPGKPGGVFVRDLRTGKLERVAGGSGPSISADGRYVAVAGSSELLDRRTGRTERLDTGLPAGFSASGELTLSANARYAAFVASGDEGYVVFLRDRVRKTTERISHPKPTWEPRDAGKPSVSDDGRYVVYDYRYAGGPRGDDWGDIWMYDRAKGTRTQIDRSYDGSTTERESLEPSLSGDGRSVVFESADTHLVPDDRDKSWNVFVHDVASGANKRVRPAAGTATRESYTRLPAVSADGRYITFTVYVEKPGGGTAYPVYLRDLKTGSTALVSPDPAGGVASATVEPGGIADGGRRIAFWSYDGTLTPAGDTNDDRDAFVRHLR
ncbi:TolB family protein [Streptomyces adelaidensis]|uniref:TolB family protein n=1 Tax=Streptomyces adelaidensis TaxID=2796465 RepID=UPI001908E597|nr:PD40 domain-containing protein [Streptomyces adelaidensis]